MADDCRPPRITLDDLPTGRPRCVVGPTISARRAPAGGDLIRRFSAAVFVGAFVIDRDRVPVAVGRDLGMHHQVLNVNLAQCINRVSDPPEQGAYVTLTSALGIRL